ncbi:MAG: hypothetical protein IPJ58_13110 [Ardenticatenia bacterium]|nr:hypothetical protein [Ardenticatenia bacterium]
MVIDLDNLSSSDVMIRFPAVFQWVFEKVKPERDQNREPYRRDNWWLFGRKNTELRSGLSGLVRYVATVETSKHRVFVFLDASILPDNKLVNIALDDAYFLGVLSSRIHVKWTLATGSTFGRQACLRQDHMLRTIPLPNPHRRPSHPHPRPRRSSTHTASASKPSTQT